MLDIEIFSRAASALLLRNSLEKWVIYWFFPRCARSFLKEFLRNWGILYGGDLTEKIDFQNVKSRDGHLWNLRYSYEIYGGYLDENIDFHMLKSRAMIF